MSFYEYHQNNSGESIEEFDPGTWLEDGFNLCVHYADGRKVWK
jgi:hypothetical protein